MKRYVYIIIGIIVVAGIALLALFFIKNRSANSTTIITTTGSLPAVGSQTGSGPTGSTTLNGSSTMLTLPATSSSTAGAAMGQSAIGSFGVLSNDPVADYFIDSYNNITAVQPDGQIIAISNGQSTTLSTSTTADLISAKFSYDGEKILISSGNQANPQATLFDLKTKTWATLPRGMQSPQWGPNNYQIAYLSAAGTGKLALSIINASSLKSGVATLLTLDANDLGLSWISKNQFILSDKPTSYNNGSIWLFNSTSGALTPVIYETNGAEAIWSRTTSTIGLVFSNGTSGQNQSLQLETTGGDVLQQLNFITLPSKCLFNGERTPTSTTMTTSSAYIALYCGIPRASSNFSSARLPDDYETMALFTTDDIYKINTTNGQTQSLWNDQTQNIDTSDLKITNGTLFFINRYNNELYGLVLQ